MPAIFDVIDRLKVVNPLSRHEVETALGVSLAVQPNANPYCTYYEARDVAGLFRSVELSVSNEPTSDTGPQIYCVLRPEIRVSFREVTSRYGMGTLFQSIPNMGPEGTAVYTWPESSQSVFMGFSATSMMLGDVTVRRNHGNGTL